MKKIVICLALAALLATGGQAFAELCTIDQVPAATLLLPYFEVDLGSPTGVTTLFSVNNASAAAAIAHVTVWSDWSVPIIDFDIYLTGYDVQTINMRDILNGVLPQTGPTNSVSNLGDFSFGQLVGVNGASCGVSPGVPPVYNPLDPVFVDQIQKALTGQALPAGLQAGLCAGANHGDNVARGYITIDSVQDCNALFPTQAGYHGVLTDNRNILWGDYFHVDSDNNFAQGDTLVHIEAGTSLGDFAPSGNTFYGRYVAAGGDASLREPLPNTYATRYLQGGIFDGGTSLAVWRSPFSEAASPVSCGSGGPAAWYPMGQAQIVVFDEEENPLTQSGTASGAPVEQQSPFPLETQLVPVAGNITIGAPFGWFYLNLDVPGILTGYDQAWVTPIMSALGRFSVGFDAIALNNGCDAQFVVLPQFLP